jgi:hypothetical protein
MDPNVSISEGGIFIDEGDIFRATSFGNDAPEGFLAYAVEVHDDRIMALPVSTDLEFISESDLVVARTESGLAYDVAIVDSFDPCAVSIQQIDGRLTGVPPDVQAYFRLGPKTRRVSFRRLQATLASELDPNWETKYDPLAVKPFHHAMQQREDEAISAYAWRRGPTSLPFNKTPLQEVHDSERQKFIKRFAEMAASWFEVQRRRDESRRRWDFKGDPNLNPHDQPERVAAWSDVGIAAVTPASPRDDS